MHGELFHLDAQAQPISGNAYCEGPSVRKQEHVSDTYVGGGRCVNASTIFIMYFLDKYIVLMAF